MRLFKKNKHAISQKDLAIIMMYDRFHRGGYIFPKKNIYQRLKGYNWYIPKFIVPYIYFENGLIRLNIEDVDENIEPLWTSAKVIQNVFNTDMKYFMYEKYDVIYFSKKVSKKLMNQFFIFIQLLFGVKYRINVLISEDSSKCGLENFPIKYRF
jgi:hypothetical protein